MLPDIDRIPAARRRRAHSPDAFRGRFRGDGVSGNGQGPTKDRVPRKNEAQRQPRLALGFLLARTTGIEPATTGSTVRYSNQLSYVPVRGGQRD